MPLIYITGISGSGKSSVREELLKRGYETYGTDEDDLAHFYNNETSEPIQHHVTADERTPEWRSQHTWKVQRAAVEKLHEKARLKPIFLCGVVANDADELWDLFDIIFALTVDEETLRHRIVTRKNNDHGKNAHEFANLLEWQKTAAEDYKKLGASLIDASRPLQEVVGEIIRKVETKAKAIVFDIDGTLSPEISWLALTRDLGASVDGHIRIYTDYKEGRATYEESKRQLISTWQATGNATKPFFQKLFADLKLQPNAHDIIAELKKQYIVCLITGSMDLYAEIVAGKVGARQWYANTRLVWSEQDELIDMDYELNQADKKLEQFAQFCAANKLEPQDCIVVGDSENDLGLFKLSGKGILVLGNEKAKEYEQYAWKVIPDLAALKQTIT